MPPFRSVAAAAPLIMVAFAVGCGRSSLTDELGTLVSGDDAGEVADVSSPPPLAAETELGSAA
jgi:hypothetical protein